MVVRCPHGGEIFVTHRPNIINEKRQERLRLARNPHELDFDPVRFVQQPKPQ